MAQLLIPNPSTASPALQQMGASIQAGLSIGNQALQAAQMMNQRLQAEQKMLRDTFHQDRLFRFERQKEAFDQQIKSEQERRANALFGPQLTNLDLRNEQQAIELGYLPQDIESQLRSRDAGTESTQFLTETRRKREPFELLGLGQTIEGNAIANRVAEATAPDRITSAKTDARRQEFEYDETIRKQQANQKFWEELGSAPGGDEAKKVILKYASDLDPRDLEFSKEWVSKEYGVEIPENLVPYQTDVTSDGRSTTRYMNPDLLQQRYGSNIKTTDMTMEQMVNAITKVESSLQDLESKGSPDPDVIRQLQRYRDSIVQRLYGIQDVGVRGLFPDSAGDPTGATPGNSTGSPGARRYLLPNQ